MKKTIIIILMCIAICGCGNTPTNNSVNSTISCVKKEELMSGEKQAVLIDVRSNEEFNDGHLDDAINIEYDNIIKELNSNDSITFDTHIIVYCRSGNRSSIAYQNLINAGYKNVYDLGAMSNCV